MSKYSPSSPRVYLVGAGPGDRGLITVRGLQLLEDCDCVVYDYLANPELLDAAPNNAEWIYVGKIVGEKHKTQDEINAILLQTAQKYKRIVRLKGGDPLMFGRGGEEAAVLHAHDIYFEIIPGVTSGLAVPCYAGIPITHRDCSSSAVFLTGREKTGKTESAHDWAALATVGTIVCYMGVAAFSEISRQLMDHGKAASTPAAVIQWGTYDRQRVVIGTLESLAEKINEQKITSPSIIVIGEVVNCRHEMAWYDQRPLFSKRIMVTRSQKQQGTLATLLRDAGATVIHNPSMRVEATPNRAHLDAAIDACATLQWIAFTSQNAVAYFMQRIFERALDVRIFATLKIAAVGPATARALEDYGLRADCVPTRYDAEHLAAAMNMNGKNAEQRGSVLLPQANNARPVLADGLRDLGFTVQQVECYCSITEENSYDVTDKNIDAVTFASSVTVQRFVAQVGSSGVAYLIKNNCQFIAIGKQTAASMRDMSLPVSAIADESTLSSLVDACIDSLPRS